MVFPAITLSQPNYSYDCFVGGVVVVVGLYVVLSLCGGGGWWVVFPAITLSQPNYSYGCFVVGVVVVVGL